MGFQNIIDNQGFSLVVTGMSIVFLALVMVSVLIALLPKVLAVASALLPPEAPEPVHERPARINASSEEAVVAAIGIALHRRGHRE